MTLANRQGIWSVAELVRQCLKLTTPVTLEALMAAIKAIGGQCISISSPSTEKGDIDAYIDTANRNDGVNFRIEYADWKPQTRILFSIAHELGHLFLHLLEGTGTIKPEKTLYRDLQASSQEWEANEFAAALLMPASEFIDEYDKLCQEHGNGNRDIITEIANHFNVSTQAATVRGQILQLW